MEKQLEISFREFGNYFHSVDSKKYDFVVYNQGAFDMTEDEIMPEDLLPLRYKELTPIIKKLKSEAWSCGCIWFFVCQEEGIYLMNVYDEHFWLCTKHSYKFIQMYLNAPFLMGGKGKK